MSWHLVFGATGFQIIIAAFHIMSVDIQSLYPSKSTISFTLQISNLAWLFVFHVALRTAVVKLSFVLELRSHWT
jgi:hypothetical protein